MSKHGKIIVVDFDTGYAHAAPCDHAWRLKDGDTVRMYDPCPVCADNKAARLKELNNILEWFPDGSKFTGDAIALSISERIAELEGK
ncbi:hypothetical protein LCGC14_1279080 [marine sediment metagenome]|uniref:Uncharacterized protein n=1 Tax=marine sediment metagenome TaxID=412755 RepID=A0A0F9KVQ2_9ZZZZ